MGGKVSCVGEGDVDMVKYTTPIKATITIPLISIIFFIGDREWNKKIKN
jgi:hypothetical protein